MCQLYFDGYTQIHNPCRDVVLLRLYENTLTAKAEQFRQWLAQIPQSSVSLTSEASLWRIFMASQQ